MVAGAVILHKQIVGLDDSKELTKALRNKLAQQISQNADVGLGWVTPAEVDSLGLTEAVRLAMQRAINQLNTSAQGLDPCARVIIDGNYNFLRHIPGSEAVVRADSCIPAVSAASIVAKVARDTYMEQLNDQYAKWQFHKHVGYGTALHSQLLAEFGVSDLHRLSYKPISRLL